MEQRSGKSVRDRPSLKESDVDNRSKVVKPEFHMPLLKRSLPLLLVSIIAGGCMKAGFDQIEPVVDRDLVFFYRNEIPLELQQIIENYRIIVLGKTNFVQEHHEFNELLLERYGPGGLLFFNEYPNALNWMVEDYITGAIDYMPPEVRSLNQLWLEKIREINLESGGEHPVRFVFTDVNHSKNDFQEALQEAENLIGAQTVFTGIRIMKPDTRIYAEELSDLNMLLINDQQLYIELWGAKWYNRFLQMIQNEIESNTYRKQGIETTREKVMHNMVENALAAYPDHRAFINCGMNHAQKETHMGPGLKRLGGYLHESHPGETYSIAFVGIEGQRKYRFDDVNLVNFNILETASEDDLVRIIGEKSGKRLSLLPLEDPVFIRKMDVTYTAGTVYVPPGDQFDAIISYPEIHVLESLDDYKY